MSRVFPERFDLEKLHGPRAGNFTKPEDAFQQLAHLPLFDLGDGDF
jgi:hypothetical protein